MRRDLLACGILVLFLGLVFQAVSRVVVQPEPVDTWSVVSLNESNPPVDRLQVEGVLEKGDTFQIYFSLRPPEPPILPEDIGLEINVTDPQNHKTFYPVGLTFRDGRLMTLDPAPTATANHTGNYKVEAWALWGITMSYLSLERHESLEQEPQYPYEVFHPISIGFLGGGVVVSLLGVRSSRRKRTRYKRLTSKRKS